MLSDNDSSLAPNIIAPDTVVVAGDHVVDSPLQQGLALLNTQSGEYFQLNDGGRAIWDLARSPVRIQTIAEAMIGRFPQHSDRVAADVSRIVRQMIDAGLMQECPDCDGPGCDAA